MTTRTVQKTVPMMYRDSNGSHWESTTTVSYKTQSGGNTGNYHANPKPKPLPVNYYAMDAFTQVPGSQSYVFETINSDGSREVFSSTIANIGSDFVGPRNTLVSECQMKLNRKILSQVKDMKVNLAQAAAEASQTANLLGSTARRITGAFTSLRRGNYMGAIKALNCSLKPRAFNRYTERYPKNPIEAAGNAWLELQYGWKPLLQDAYGAAEAIAKSRGSRPLYESIRVTASATAKIDDVVSDTGPGYSNYSDSRGSAGAYGTAKITFMVDNPSLKLASGVGLTDPALLAWELLPYSFVVDWFLPVGNWLENCNATSGVTFVSGFSTIKYVSEGSNSLRNASWSPYHVTETKTSGAMRKDISLIRSPMSAFPANPLPKFKNPISFDHCANALALLTTAFRR